MADNRANTTIEADVMTPGQLSAACRTLGESDFPAQVKMGNGEPVHLASEYDARLFSLGVHFGGMAEHGLAHKD